MSDTSLLPLVLCLQSWHLTFPLLLVTDVLLLLVTDVLLLLVTDTRLLLVTDILLVRMPPQFSLFAARCDTVVETEHSFSLYAEFPASNSRASNFSCQPRWQWLAQAHSNYTMTTLLKLIVEGMAQQTGLPLSLL